MRRQRFDLGFLFRAPAPHRGEIRHLQIDELVEALEQHLVTQERVIYEPTEARVTVLVALEVIDRLDQVSGRLRARAKTPALDDDDVGGPFDGPTRRLDTIVHAFVEPRHRRRRARDAVEHAHAQVDVMGAGDAARSQQRMHGARQLEPLCSRQVEVV